MDFYIDIHLKPNANLREAELSRQLYSKFHIALVTLNTDKIGISFPLVDIKLGHVFRIHGDRCLLQDLQELGWLDTLKDYYKTSDITHIPNEVHYRVVSAKKSNMSNAKLKRLIARGNIDKDGIKYYKIKMLSQGFDNPYLDLFSHSTGQLYRKFFEFSEVKNVSVDGVFDSYGLSNVATVPWFSVSKTK